MLLGIDENFFALGYPTFFKIQSPDYDAQRALLLPWV